MANIARSQEYVSFRSTVPQKKLVVDNDSTKIWTFYDAGPRTVRCPLICFPPVSGTADVFFKQLLALSGRGYRVLAVEYPVYWTIPEFCEGFRKFMDHLNLDKVHLFGSSLGGFLAQKFAEYTHQCPRVESLILCNSFCDTSVFQYSDTAFVFWVTPALLLKKLIMGNLPRSSRDPEVAYSVDFMVEKLDGLNQAELASRLTLNCTSSYVEPQKLRAIPTTIMDVFDECALSQRVREDLYKCYPDAKMAHLKGGGNFPFLSRSDEVNLHLLIHLRRYNETSASACDQIPETLVGSVEEMINNAENLQCP